MVSLLADVTPNCRFIDGRISVGCTHIAIDFAFVRLVVMSVFVLAEILVSSRCKSFIFMM